MQFSRPSNRMNPISEWRCHRPSECRFTATAVSFLFRLLKHTFYIFDRLRLDVFPCRTNYFLMDFCHTFFDAYIINKLLNNLLWIAHVVPNFAYRALKVAEPPLRTFCIMC